MDSHLTHYHVLENQHALVLKSVGRMNELRFPLDCRSDILEVGLFLVAWVRSTRKAEGERAAEIAKAAIHSLREKARLAEGVRDD